MGSAAQSESAQSTRPSRSRSRPSEDGIGALWVPALDRVAEEDVARLSDRLTRFVRRKLEYGRAEELDELWAQLEGVKGARGRALVEVVSGSLAAEIESATSRKGLEADLESRDLARTRAALARVEALDPAEQEELVGALYVATSHCGTDPGAAAALLRIWRAIGRDQGGSRCSNSWRTIRRPRRGWSPR